jgi:hypothetical protein
MVIGHYVYDCHSAFSKCDTEELTLNGDGTFVQRYSPPGGQPSETNTGRWTLYESENRIHFTNLRTWEGNRDRLGLPVDPASPRSYDLPVSMYGNTVHIELDLDLGTSFEQDIPRSRSR